MVEEKQINIHQMKLEKYSFIYTYFNIITFSFRLHSLLHVS
jgi:hypothetical protein